jgi:hypothetical protein
MKRLTLLILLFLTIHCVSQTNKAQLSPGEKSALILDSLVKAKKVKYIAVYFHTIKATAVTSGVVSFPSSSVEQFLVSEFEIFQFQGQFIVLTDDRGLVRYFNLEKLIHFMLVKESKDQFLKLYFQI